MSWLLFVAVWLGSAALGAPPADEQPASVGEEAGSLSVELLPGEVRARPGATALAWVTIRNGGVAAMTSCRSG